jgi:hypothetical protein
MLVFLLILYIFLIEKHDTKCLKSMNYVNEIIQYNKSKHFVVIEYK